MRRRLLIIAAILLLAGAVVNVAVAWGCAQWSSVGSETIIGNVRGRQGFGLRITSDSTPHGLHDTVGDWRTAAGFPFLCLDGGRWESGAVSGIADRRLPIPVDKPQYKISILYAATLPVHPTFRGFAANTLIYAAALGLLILGPYALRSLRRTRRGLCPACAYPMGDSEVCTECGQPLLKCLRAIVPLPKRTKVTSVKRWPLALAVYLLAGAIVNLAVAWACAFIGTTYETARIEVVHAPRTHAVFVLTAFGREIVIAHPALNIPPHLVERRLSGFEKMGFDIEVRETANDWSKIRVSGMWSRDPAGYFTGEEACGWPRVCLRWYARTSSRGHDTFGCLALGGSRQYMMHGMSFPFPEGDRSLPLIPIWPGIAVNTIFYAVLLWLPFVVRRWVRARRGLCPHCAYPMGDSEVCTECGKPLPGRERLAT